MKAYIVARSIQGKTDSELRALDAIIYGPVHEYETDHLTTKIGDELMDEFEKLHPLCGSWHIAVETK